MSSDRKQDKADRAQDRTDRARDKADKSFLLITIAMLFAIAAMVFTLDVICLMKGIDGEVTRYAVGTLSAIGGAILTLIIFYWKYGRRKYKGGRTK
jgi:cytochrome c oxidase assembly protein Cox11